MNYTYALHFLEAKRIWNISKTQTGEEREGFSVGFGVGGGGSRMTKEHENLGKIPIMSIISSPTTLYIHNSPLQSPFPSISGVATATRRKTNIWLCPSGHFYNAGWDALENPISSPTAIWPQVVISNNVCFHWFLWTQTKAATTFFFPPKSFKLTVVAV